MKKIISHVSFIVKYYSLNLEIVHQYKDSFAFEVTGPDYKNGWWVDPNSNPILFDYDKNIVEALRLS